MFPRAVPDIQDSLRVPDSIYSLIECYDLLLPARLLLKTIISMPFSVGKDDLSDPSEEFASY